MSGAPGAYPGPEALELLERILNEKEYIAVLKYCNAHHLESDSEVLFLVAMLKVFAHVFGDICHIIKVADAIRGQFEAICNTIEFNLHDALSDELGSVRTEIGRIDGLLATHATHFEVLSERLALLTEEIRSATRNAENVFSGYQSRGDKSKGSTLSEMIYNQARVDVDKRAARLESNFAGHVTELIESKLRNTNYLVAGMLVLQLVIILVLLT